MVVVVEPDSDPVKLNPNTLIPPPPPVEIVFILADVTVALVVVVYVDFVVNDVIVVEISVRTPVVSDRVAGGTDIPKAGAVAWDKPT